MLLKVENITVRYGKALALDNVSIEVSDQSVVSIIGANGAGKSTLMKALSGLAPITIGKIWFNKKRIDNLKTHEIVKAGLVHIPEGRKLFPYLSVLTNLQLGASLRHDKLGIKRDLAQVFEHFPILAERLNQKAGTLSGGQQQMLAIGRGLMAGPRLLLMDEPSLGLDPIKVKELQPVIRNIRKRGVSVLLAEQNIPLALGVATRGYALQVGKVVQQGDIETFQTSDLVRKAYLGG